MVTLSRNRFESLPLEGLCTFVRNSCTTDVVMNIDELKEYAKKMLEKDNFYMALHIIDTLYELENQEVGYPALYFIYDRSTGAATSPKPITYKSDLLDFIRII